MLEVINLQCARGDRCLFRDLSFQVETGECLVLHGENGSGKTSLLRMLAGLTPPASGTISWHGLGIQHWGDDYGRQLLYSGHSQGLKEDLSATENLIFSSALAGDRLCAETVSAALENAGLHDRRNLPVRALSQGQKRRVNLTRLLLQKRKLWLLDEPLTALDNKASEWVTGLMNSHLNEGGTIVLTTHQDVALEHATQAMRLNR